MLTCAIKKTVQMLIRIIDDTVAGHAIKGYVPLPCNCNNY